MRLVRGAHREAGGRLPQRARGEPDRAGVGSGGLSVRAATGGDPGARPLPAAPLGLQLQPAAAAVDHRFVGREMKGVRVIGGLGGAVSPGWRRGGPRRSRPVAVVRMSVTV
ncbi:hypothetical protein EASAB2608_00708 [Streptomyces sp. EAS-AB2608]|nr:hypothetical protein EASAB2608_00708 [Streptomyces sp. EAS-AB2608]